MTAENQIGKQQARYEVESRLNELDARRRVLIGIGLLSLAFSLIGGKINLGNEEIKTIVGLALIGVGMVGFDRALLYLGEKRRLRQSEDQSV